MSLADRATIGNMGPEYGATCGFFPVERRDHSGYLALSTSRTDDRIALVEAYAKANGMYRDASSADPVFTDTLELDLATVVPSLAGPKRPEGRVALTDIKAGFETSLATEYKKPGELDKRVTVEGKSVRHRPRRRRDRRDHIVHRIRRTQACSSPPALVAP